MVAVAGSVFFQFLLLRWLFAEDLESGPTSPRFQFAVAAVLGIVTVQVSIVCVWRLLTMARLRTVFSQAAFRYVDIMIAAVTAASALALWLCIALAPGRSPSLYVVLLISGAAVVSSGLALVVLDLRRLLTQAIARDLEAGRLQAELDAVI